MGEIKGKTLETDEEVVIRNPEPLESAVLYKKVSDEIWKRQDPGSRWSYITIPSVINPLEALKLTNEFAGSVSERLLRAGEGREIELTGPWGDKVSLKPDAPVSAGVGTYHWDPQFTWRRTKVKGKMMGVEFTDGHLDYARELYIGFGFEGTDDGHLSLRYGAQRYEYGQSEPTHMYINAWYSAFAETGYEGNSIGDSKLTVEQELKFLGLIQELGGLSIEP